MALETVNIDVVSDDLVPVDVDGVTIQIYDETGTTLLTTDVTGSVTTGSIQVLLNGSLEGTRYQLRFHYVGGTVVSPQYIDVFSPPTESPTDTNNFEVEATLFTLPAATNPRLCRCSGYFKTITGRPLKGADIFFLNASLPIMADGQAILGGRVHAKTDANGYLQIDLWRTGCYDVTIEGLEDCMRSIEVPDRSSVSLVNLLFPVPGQIIWDPVGPWALAVGESLQVTPTITATDYRELEGTASDDVEYTVEDTAVATVAVSETYVTITGVAAGTTNLVVSRKDESMVYLPDTGIAGGTVAITIS